MNRKRKPPPDPPSGDPEDAIAAFIRRRGVTRCPTACATATQASPPPADRAALARYNDARERWRQSRSTALRSPWSQLPPGGWHEDA